MAAPANDNLTSAEVLVGESGTVFGQNLDATNDTGYYDAIADVFFGFGGSASVWYKLAVPGDWSATTTTVGIRATVFIDLTYTRVPVVGLFDFTSFPPADETDTVFLTSGYPAPPPGSGTLFTYSGAAPASGFFYIGVGSPDGSPTPPIAFYLNWQFSDSANPEGVAISFDGGAFNTSPFWTRLDA